MKIVRNNIIPFPGFKAINLFGILFVRGKSLLKSTDLTHEEIHTAQMKEMLYIFFYIWYAAEWLIKLIIYRNAKEAYYNISFEKEAYVHQGSYLYLSIRKHYAWWNFL